MNTGDELLVMQGEVNPPCQRQEDGSVVRFYQ